MTCPPANSVCTRIRDGALMCKPEYEYKPAAAWGLVLLDRGWHLRGCRNRVLLWERLSCAESWDGETVGPAPQHVGRIT